MHLVALNGSPRKQGNTDILLDQIIKGFTELKGTTEKVYLTQNKVQPCLDCRKCKASPYICPLKDDMPRLIPILEKAEVLVFGTPIYWYGPTAQMKLLIDRLRPFIVNKHLQGKLGVLVVPSEEGAPICDPIVKMFQMSFQYVGMNYGGAFLTAAYEKGEIVKNLSEMNRAYDFGKNLASKTPPLC